MDTSYDRLYQDAISDPTLKRTRQELEVAMANANLARQVVFELFQDLDRFNLGDYRKFDDQGRGMQRLVDFVSRTARLLQWDFRKEDASRWTLMRDGKPPLQFTSDRDRALQDENLQLLGLEHPIIDGLMRQYSALDPGIRAVTGRVRGLAGGGLLTIWKVDAQGKDGQSTHHVVRIGMNKNGDRAPWLERLGDKVMAMESSTSVAMKDWQQLARDNKQRLQELLHRELNYSGIINEESSYSAVPLAVIALEE